MTGPVFGCFAVDAKQYVTVNGRLTDGHGLAVRFTSFSEADAFAKRVVTKLSLTNATVVITAWEQE
jgi:hypothetical protein